MGHLLEEFIKPTEEAAKKGEIMHAKFFNINLEDKPEI